MCEAREPQKGLLFSFIFHRESASFLLFHFLPFFLTPFLILMPPPPLCYWNIIDIQQHKYQVYNIVIDINYHHSRSSYHMSAFRYYNIIDYIPWAVHFISMTHLFYNWKFVPSNHPHLFHPFPPIPLCSSNHLFVFCLYESCFVYSFVWFLDSTYKWTHTVYIFLCLIYLT